MMLERIKKIFRPFYVPILRSLRGPKRYRILFDTIALSRPRRIMEIGTWRGDRAVQMIQKAQHVSPGVHIEYYGFDLFEEMTPTMLHAEISKEPLTKKVTEEKIQKTGATVRLVQGDTTKLDASVWRALPPMDFVFIDGGHSKETILSDWEHVRALMHEKTVVIFDDYWPLRMDAGAKPIVDAIDRNEYDVSVLPTRDVFKKAEGTLVVQCARVRKQS